MPRIFRRDRPLVRPWALAGPILILMLVAPLLRPLRAPGRPSPAERVTLESVRAILHDGTLAINPHRVLPADPVFRTDGRTFAQDPPAFDAALAGIGWALERVGVMADTNPHWFAYLLTLFGVALPTAIACGLIYRTTRSFELRRPWRLLLSLSCVLGSGWFAYATSLRPGATAAAGVMAALACGVQFVRAKKPGRSVGWLALAGLCSAGAAVIEPLAIWSMLAVGGAVILVRTPVRWRITGLLLLLAGAAGPVALHATLNVPLTGDLKPPRWHLVSGPAHAPAEDEEDDLVPANAGGGLGRAAERLVTLTVGEHGFLSHFPVLIVGLAGAGWVLRRHWPGSFKVLAGGTLAALAGALVYKSLLRPDWIDGGYAAPRLIVFTPALMLWGGAWLRRRRGAVVWAATAVALAVSVASSLIGAISVPPPDGYTHYTLAEAVERLFGR